MTNMIHKQKGGKKISLLVSENVLNTSAKDFSGTAGFLSIWLLTKYSVFTEGGTGFKQYNPKKLGKYGHYIVA